MRRIPRTCKASCDRSAESVEADPLASTRVFPEDLIFSLGVPITEGNPETVVDPPRPQIGELFPVRFKSG